MMCWKLGKWFGIMSKYMKYAIVKTGGKQYKVAEGNVVEFENLKETAGKQLVLDAVLLFVNEDSVQVGRPTLSNVTILAKVLEQIRGEKIRVAKFKAKARYRKVYGHRQNLTRVQIETITDKNIEEKPVKKATVQEDKEPVKKTVAKAKTAVKK